MRIIGIDPGLTRTGVAVSDRGQPWTLKPPASAGRGVRRLDWFYTQFQLLLTEGCLVVVEGYSLGVGRGRGGALAAIRLGEYGGVLRLALHRNRCMFAELPPARLKMLACGRGNADKLAVYDAARDRLGYEGGSHDEAEALWLLEAGRQAFPNPGATALPKTHRRALKDFEVFGHGSHLLPPPTRP